MRHALRSEGPPRYQRPDRPNPQLAPYEAQIHVWYFGQHLIGPRILRELRKLGYRGGPTALYTHLKALQTAVPSSKATVRFETPPGRQGQFDWSPYTLEIGGELTKVIMFGLPLGYSRHVLDLFLAGARGLGLSDLEYKQVGPMKIARLHPEQTVSKVA